MSLPESTPEQRAEERIAAVCESSSLFLDLSSLELKSVPDSVGKLKWLQRLSISDNRITTLPATLLQLEMLVRLDVENNQLASLPDTLRQLKGLKWLSLQGNEALGLPPEVLEKAHNPVEILDYYFRILPQAVPGRRPGKPVLRELKIILIGRGEVGKSSLVDVLKKERFVPGKTQTEGIDITQWPMDLEDGKATARVWDFGGQEIMHGTHQFFLTRRSLYLVVVDGRHDRQNQDAEHWLKYARAFGGDSPVFIILNKQGAGREHPYDVNRGELARKYGVKLDHFFLTDCADARSIDALRAAIMEQAEEMLSRGELFPPEFMPIRERLIAMGENGEEFLSDSDYRKLCRELNVPEKEGRDEFATALCWLTDLGTVVSFPDDDNLSNLIILKPEWVTAGIYRVLNDARLRDQKHGELSMRELTRILPAERWPPEHHRYLMDLMQKFELCFRLVDAETTLLVPELLPDSEPTLAEWEAEKCMVFMYKYPVLPHGVLPRFITRTHELSQAGPRWRSGVVLTDEEAQAVVRTDYNAAEVSVWVRAQHEDQRRSLLVVVRKHFQAIHKRIGGLEVQEYVAVPGHPKVTVPYADLLADARDQRETVRVTIGKQRVDWPLAELLNGFTNPSVRAYSREKKLGDAQIHHHYYSANTQPTFPMGDIITQNIDGGIFHGPVAAKMEHCTTIIGQQPAGEKKVLLEQLRGEATALLKALPKNLHEEASEDFKMLVDQASAGEPTRKWYSASAKGLLEASAFVRDFTGNIAGTIGQLGKLLWPDFTLPDLSTDKNK